jgi:hypothetical protein
MIGLGPEQSLDFHRNNLALGRPANVEAVLDLAADLLREREGLVKDRDEIMGALDDVLRAFDRLETAKGKAKLEALYDLADELRYVGRLVGHVSLEKEDKALTDEEGDQ